MKSNMIFENALSDYDCNYINSEAEKILNINDAIVGETTDVSDGLVKDSIRKSKTGFIESWNSEHLQLWNYVSSRLWNYINSANRTNFAFDVSYLDSVQYTKYESGGDYYDWHIDTFIETPNAFHRKLSITVQLSDGSEYEGGNFELNDGTGSALPQDSLRKKGTILIFPSFLLHRVTPVIAGTRKTLVAWVEGRHFR